ncbi:hypothetical protein ACFYV5_01715 [Streptomyces sp. NPDC003035]|uniref:hypothetical protein n=1 Tax=Streptomyces sp. NPDC003035 TaxID=3364676 RepID=UPI0036BCE5FF
MTTARLAPGVALVTVPGQGLAVRTADGEFLRVDTGTAAAEDVVARLTEGRGGAELDTLAEAFEEAGYARDPATPAEPPLTGRTVLLLGDPLLTGPLARCARDAGAEVRTGTPQDLADVAGDPATAVVWCLDGPVPAGLWDEADRLPAGGTAWLRCHREGAQLWLEPPACRPGDVTAADVRLRRLAATPAHRELAAYWQGRYAGDTGPGHRTASAALAAALLTADLLAWATDPDGPRLRAARRTLRRIDLRSLAVTDHPVLPVPPVAPIPSAAGAPGVAGAGIAVPGRAPAGPDASGVADPQGAR